MIIPDVNLLVYAHNSSAKQHPAVSRWFENAITGVETVGISWAVAFGFVRLLSNPKVVQDPDRPEALVSIVQSWFTLPAVRAITPGIRHLDIVYQLFLQSGCSGRLTTDIHIAALAIELNAVVYSNDLDFSRFAGLKWKNPL